MEEIKGKKGKALIILVGNTINVDKREVATGEGMRYYETSAKTGCNINEMIEDFIIQLMSEEDMERKNDVSNEIDYRFH